MIAFQEPNARHLIEDAIERHGAIAVLKAAALAVLRDRPRRKAHPPDAGGLSGHLRRDIGLAVEPEAADWTRFRV